MSKVIVIKNLDMPDYFDGKNIKYKKYDKFPFVVNSKGRSVTPINMYLSSYLHNNYSEHTIKRIAHCLSLLINYCDSKNLRLIDFMDDDLVSFSKSLQDNTRNNTTINNVISCVLDFFDFFGKNFLDNDNYIKNIFNVEYSNQNINGKEFNKLRHKSMLLNSDKKTGNPINAETIDLLYRNIDKIYKSKFTQERTKILLILLEHTGARLGEIALIKIRDIKEALLNNNMLKLITLKRKSEYIRYVPLSKLILNQVDMFIKIHRNKIIKNTVGTKDDGFLFINELTGLKMNSNSLGNDFNRLKKEIGIDNEISAHMFRHRFITNIFISLIKEYDIENNSGVRNALLDIETLKAHVQELTGHKDIKSLDSYLHLAKSELANMPEILKKLEKNKDKDALEAKERYLLNDLKLGNITTDEYIKEIDILKIYGDKNER